MNKMIEMEDIQKLRETYQRVFTQGDGVKVLEDLELRFHIHNTTMDNDINNLAYLEGQRTVILFLKNMIKGEMNNGRRKPGSARATSSSV